MPFPFLSGIRVTMTRAFTLRCARKKPLIKHREFKFWDKGANARIDSKLA